MKERSRKKVILAVTLSTLFLLIGGGTVLFHSLEDWTWIQSFYFTIVTITTVGYGDIAPSNDETRLVASIFILFGVGIGAGIISYFGGAIMRNRVTKRLNDK